MLLNLRIFSDQWIKMVDKGHPFFVMAFGAFVEIIHSMPFEKIDIDSITEERRKSIAKSIRTASPEEVKKLGDQVFHDLDDPWRDEFFKFIEEHRDSIIYHATDPITSR